MDLYKSILSIEALFNGILKNLKYKTYFILNPSFLDKVKKWNNYLLFASMTDIILAIRKSLMISDEKNSRWVVFIS